MAALSGSFTGPAVTGQVDYAAGKSIVLSLAGEWPRALITVEVSQDEGASWRAFGPDHGIGGLSRVSGSPDEETELHFGIDVPGDSRVIRRTITPPGPGLVRLRCTEFRSGWCNWTLSS